MRVSILQNLFVVTLALLSLLATHVSGVYLAQSECQSSEYCQNKCINEYQLQTGKFCFFDRENGTRGGCNCGIYKVKQEKKNKLFNAIQVNNDESQFEAQQISTSSIRRESEVKSKQ
ncbi:UNKNOWN [Stylonychia lemnae]|uniref:Transmembrane protein n=1 Tax=Stylonychia lemnae TaxID=5949 RepID=A0A078AHX8_STYLE|nr:UNKNOWN [Stylonychia lemnae]|eukprot:CDW81521.1 UNKNOWN [Stylonychia lemnae]